MTSMLAMRLACDRTGAVAVGRSIAAANVIAKSVLREKILLQPGDLCKEMSTKGNEVRGGRGQAIWRPTAAGLRVFDSNSPISAAALFGAAPARVRFCDSSGCARRGRTVSSR